MIEHNICCEGCYKIGIADGRRHALQECLEIAEMHNIKINEVIARIKEKMK